LDGKEDVHVVLHQEQSGMALTCRQAIFFLCDYTLNNFDARQAARAAEIDALNGAKAILSGMK